MLFNFNVKISRKESGFSLIELLAVLFIIALGAEGVAGYFGGVVNSDRADAAAKDLAGVLSRARIYALEFGEEVVVCGVNAKSVVQGNHSACSNDWSLGVVAFVDKVKESTSNKIRELSIADQLLEVSALGQSMRGVRIIKNQQDTPFFFYRANGVLSESNATVFYCPNIKDIQFRRGVILNFSGRVRIERGGEIGSASMPDNC